MGKIKLRSYIQEENKLEQSLFSLNKRIEFLNSLINIFKLDKDPEILKQIQLLRQSIKQDIRDFSIQGIDISDLFNKFESVIQKAEFIKAQETQYDLVEDEKQTQERIKKQFANQLKQLEGNFELQFEYNDIPYYSQQFNERLIQSQIDNDIYYQDINNFHMIQNQQSDDQLLNNVIFIISQELNKEIDEVADILYRRYRNDLFKNRNQLGYTILRDQFQNELQNTYKTLKLIYKEDDYKIDKLLVNIFINSYSQKPKSVSIDSMLNQIINHYNEPTVLRRHTDQVQTQLYKEIVKQLNQQKEELSNIKALDYKQFSQSSRIRQAQLIDNLKQQLLDLEQQSIKQVQPSIQTEQQIQQQELLDIRSEKSNVDTLIDFQRNLSNISNARTIQDFITEHQDQFFYDNNTRHIYSQLRSTLLDNEILNQEQKDRINELFLSLINDHQRKYEISKHINKNISQVIRSRSPQSKRSQQIRSISPLRIQLQPTEIQFQDQEQEREIEMPQQQEEQEEEEKKTLQTELIDTRVLPNIEEGFDQPIIRDEEESKSVQLQLSKDQFIQEMRQGNIEGREDLQNALAGNQASRISNNLLYINTISDYLQNEAKTFDEKVQYLYYMLQHQFDKGLKPFMLQQQNAQVPLRNLLKSIMLFMKNPILQPYIDSFQSKKQNYLQSNFSQEKKTFKDIFQNIQTFTDNYNFGSGTKKEIKHNINKNIFDILTQYKQAKKEQYNIDSYSQLFR